MHQLLRTAGGAAMLLFAYTWAAAESLPTCDIPKLSGIVIDGTGSTWGDRGLAVRMLHLLDSPIPEGHEFGSKLRIGWDDRGLLLLAEVADADAEEADDVESLYSGDSVEFFVAPSHASKDIAQFVVSAGMDPRHPGVRSRAFDHRVTPALLKSALRIEAKSSKTQTGYLVEALIPWSNLNIRPRLGSTISFQCSANDTTGRIHYREVWFPQDGAWDDAHAMYVLRLASEASPSPKAVASVDFVGGKLTVDVAALPELAGTTVEVRAEGLTLGSARLTPQDRRATAEIAFPPGPSSKPGSAMAVVANGEVLWTVTVPDYLQNAIRGLGESRMTISEPIFSGTTFPKVDFEQSPEVRARFGECSIKTTYFDSDAKPVLSPSGPGRYGALAEVSLDSRHRFCRTFELFHAAARIHWDEASRLSQKDLLLGLGLDAAAAEKASVGPTIYQGRNTAAIASLAAEMFAAKTPAALADLLFNGDLYRYRLRQTAGATSIYNVIVSLPPGYEKSKAPAPLLLFLHGSGERGDDIQMVADQGPQAQRARGKHLPFIIVSPQCPYGEWWNARALMVLLDEIEAKYRVDKTRVYVTGLSMGGFGTWELATDYPDRFAAVAPIAGGGDPKRVAAMKGVPTWAFHGALDDVVPIAGDQATVDALKAAGGDVRFTVYPTRHHDSWLPAYDDPQLYKWLLSHKLK